MNSPQNLNIHIYVNGLPVPARKGQSLAAALLASGVYVFHHSPAGQPRGLFCGMGVCFECLVTVDGQPGQRACLVPVRPEMDVRLSPEGSDGGD